MAPTRSCAAPRRPSNGGGLYRKRQATIEPVFAHTKYNRRIDRSNAEDERPPGLNGGWITASHNLLKLWRHTTASQAA